MHVRNGSSLKTEPPGDSRKRNDVPKPWLRDEAVLYTDVLPFRLQVLFRFPQGVCYSFKRKMRTENKAFFKFLYGRRAPQTKVV